MDTVAQSLGMERLNSSKRILRLIDVTESEAASATRTYDIEINAYANNWYLRVPEQARTYIIELGQLCSDGSFNLVVRSNSVCVPRAGISPLSDEEWATVNTDELIRLSRESVGRGFGSSEKGPAGQTGAGPGPGEFPGGLSSASYLGSGSVNL